LRPPRRLGIGDQAIARLRDGRSVWRRHANIHRNRLLRTRMSRVAAKVRTNAGPAERQARVRMHRGRRTRGARSQPMQQAFHGATIER
jgi:hypothetical protein